MYDSTKIELYSGVVFCIMNHTLHFSLHIEVFEIYLYKNPLHIIKLAHHYNTCNVRFKTSYSKSPLLICISLLTNGVVHLYVCLVAICVSVKCLFSILSHF